MNQVIPEAAVEAAIYAYGIDGKVHEWERKMILNILEAAAPHMLAKVWNAALQEADDQGYLYGHQTDLLKMRNPYR